jgi:hypothetical protein
MRTLEENCEKYWARDGITDVLGGPNNDSEPNNDRPIDETI